MSVSVSTSAATTKNGGSSVSHSHVVPTGTTGETTNVGAVTFGGTVNAFSRADHVHQGVHSVSYGDGALVGDVTEVAGQNMLVSSSGQTATIATLNAVEFGKVVIDNTDGGANLTMGAVLNNTVITAQNSTVNNIQSCVWPLHFVNSTSAISLHNILDALTATGTTQGTALPIVTTFSIVATVAPNTGLILPSTTTTPYSGQKLTIRNDGVNVLNLYPGVGGQINSLGANVPLTIAPSNIANVVASSLTQWYSV